MKKTTKTTVKKKVAPKKKINSIRKPEMLSYAIKMVIPTVQYGNVQPEIIVKANSPEEAHDFIVPHMNKLWKEYYLVDGKRPVPTPPAPVEVKEVEARKIEIKKEGKEVSTTPIPEINKTSPISSVALIKATQAINSCLSKEALDIIIKQVSVSVKLTDEDKLILQPLLDEAYKELNEKF